MSKGRRLRELMESDGMALAPGAYDGMTAKLIQQADFSCVYMTGGGTSSSYGYPDYGLITMSEMVANAGRIADAVDLPVISDADNGYGNPMNVHYTVQMFEEAGVAGVNLEDQVSPKRCGHMPGKEVVSKEEMVKKIEAACLARRDDDFVIIARTDALAVEGIDGTLERIRAYVAAGADAIFPDAVKTEDQIARVVEAAGGKPGSINMGFGIRPRPTTPLIPLPRLKELGVRRVSLPRMLPAAAIKAMQEALSAMRGVMETGIPADRSDLLVGIDEIWNLMGFPAMQALEKQLLTTDHYETKYKAAAKAH